MTAMCPPTLFVRSSTATGGTFGRDGRLHLRVRPSLRGAASTAGRLTATRAGRCACTGVMIQQPLGSVAGVAEACLAPGPAVNEGVCVEFEEFVRARSAALVQFGHVLTGERHAGEELAQAALVKTYPKWSRIEGDGEAYVRRVMVNTRVSWWRRHWRESPTARMPEAPVPDRTGDVDLEQLLWAALARVPARRRAALVLRFYDDLSMTQIAEVMGCRTGTAKSLVSRGLSTLRQAPELAGHHLGEAQLGTGHE